MLIVSRLEGEAVAIGEQVVVKIIDVKGKQVSVGVEAPRHMAIHRIKGGGRPQDDKVDTAVRAKD